MYATGYRNFTAMTSVTISKSVCQCAHQLKYQTSANKLGFANSESRVGNDYNIILVSYAHAQQGVRCVPRSQPMVAPSGRKTIGNRGYGNNGRFVLWFNLDPIDLLFEMHRWWSEVD